MWRNKTLYLLLQQYVEAVHNYILQTNYMWKLINKTKI